MSMTKKEAVARAKELAASENPMDKFVGEITLGFDTAFKLIRKLQKRVKKLERLNDTDWETADDLRNQVCLDFEEEFGAIGVVSTDVISEWLAKQ